MSDDAPGKDSLKRELVRRLLEARKDIPTSALGRLSRTAAAVLARLGARAD